MVKAFGDVASLLVMIGAIVKVLPAIAALFSIAWFAVQIWESDTVRGWTNRDK